jgi:DNA polymerase elongation subunit (family B)
MSDFRALILDIETAPNLAYVWGLWDQNVGLNQIVEDGHVISFAAKWLDAPKNSIEFYSEFHDDDMIEQAWRLMDEADAIIHYNGRAFDIKHLQREMVLAGLGPPSPHKDIDLLTIARSTFKFSSNKLDHISQQLGVGSKLKHNGFELWKACMAGDEKAWAKMRRYNIQDVLLTEQVYNILRPWIRTHPHVGIYTGDVDVCPKCGSTNLQKRGLAKTAVQVYQRLYCNDCGGWSRSTRKLNDPQTTRNVN